MKKTLIFCYSVHHGNTKTLVDVLADRYDVDVVTLPSDIIPDLKDYELIGFASGIYMSGFGRPIMELVEKLQGLDDKKCFTLYSSGANNDNLDKSIHAVLKRKNANLIGHFNCRGFDTFGPLKLIGGLNKGHPDASDIEAVCSFFENISM
ncbi:MAG: flavodoxin domain-containing protein [Eubacteriales bacterium]